jgi:Polysulphide reductase, NrfD
MPMRNLQPSSLLSIIGTAVLGIFGMVSGPSNKFLNIRPMEAQPSMNAGIGRKSKNFFDTPVSLHRQRRDHAVESQEPPPGSDRGEGAMPDTFFTTAPHWRCLIVLYFFVGGIAGGSFFLAALLDLFGTQRDRPMVRAGYYVALVGAVLSGILLTWDLNRPERFCHMLIQSERVLPMFKYWSPMSAGSWAPLLFGGMAFLASLGALHEAGRLRWVPLRVLHSGMAYSDCQARRCAGLLPGRIYGGAPVGD